MNELIVNINILKNMYFNKFKFKSKKFQNGFIAGIFTTVAMAFLIILFVVLFSACSSSTQAQKAMYKGKTPNPKVGR